MLKSSIPDMIPGKNVVLVGQATNMLRMGTVGALSQWRYNKVMQVTFVLKLVKSTQMLLKMDFHYLQNV